MLKIAFDAVPLLSPLTGIGHYVHQLLTQLDAMSDLTVHKFYATGWSAQLRDQPVHVNAGRLKSFFRRWIPNSYDYARSVQQKYFSAGLKSFEPDVYHEPNFLAYQFDGPSVITVHDLSWIRYPHMHPPERVRAMEKYFEPGLRRACRVITDSAFVKQELIDVFGLRPDIIHPVYLGADASFRPMTSDQTVEVLERFDLQHGQYILSLGTLEPRKNLQLALRAYMRIPAATRAQCPLVLAGMDGWQTQDLYKELEPLVRAGEVRQLGYLTREELTRVVAGACALVYPSLYEGFGLPPLEAMACGVPVIASDASSIPEVVGQAGMLVHPEDVEGVTQAMRNWIESPAERAKASAFALEQSAQFSWQQCARETVQVYRWAAS